MLASRTARELRKRARGRRRVPRRTHEGKNDHMSRATFLFSARSFATKGDSIVALALMYHTLLDVIVYRAPRLRRRRFSLPPH